MFSRYWLRVLIVAAIGLGAAVAGPGPAHHDTTHPKTAVETPKSIDLTKTPTLYLVAYAHLDTQWRWEYPTVIREYLPKTMRDNFALLDKYPHYVFNWTGAYRYQLMKEYYPRDYERLKQYVAAGRWFPAGSSIDENDVNNPSAESIIRQILYGKEYFRHDFGKTSAEYMLPDCFGFPASLPSILAHAGIKGFSTQKLTWSSGAAVGGPESPEKTPRGIPFNVGLWEGPDGKTVVAALNPLSYGTNVTYDLTKSPSGTPSNNSVDWPERVDMNGKASGLFADYSYYGTGDTGGAPRESSVKLMEAILIKSRTVLPSGVPADVWNADRSQSGGQPAQRVLVGDGPLHVVQGRSDQMFLDIKLDQESHLPRYKGDLELTEHSAGSLTSEAYEKRWNRKNEVLADDAERASVAADWLGGRTYPLQRLRDAWTLVLAAQMHDIMAGTATPKAYEYSWNDSNIAMNQFVAVLTSATSGVASRLDTQVSGIPVIVYNPLNIPREDIVEANLTFPEGQPKAMRVKGPDGREVPSQISSGKVLFLAKVPSVAYAVYNVEPSSSFMQASELKVSETSLEDARYVVKLDPNGDVSSIFDKSLQKELLAQPIRLALHTDRPRVYPAWNMEWSDQKAPARSYVSGPALVRIAENGAARVAVEITREAEGSKFVQTIRLSGGDAGNRVEFSNAIDWKTSASNLKTEFALKASNPLATYNWDIGTIQRPNDNEKLYEMVSHQWFDLTNADNSFGVTVLSDTKNGSDKPDDNVLRLTLLRSPGMPHPPGAERPADNSPYADQATQDWGHHEFVYGLAAHGGDWRQGESYWQGERLNQPLVAFQSTKHRGPLGKSFSLLKVSSDRVRVLALKKAESSEEYVVRLVELDGKAQHDVHIAFVAPILAAREINGAEEAVGVATLDSGELVTNFTPYQPRSFAVNLASSNGKSATSQSETVKLPYDRSVATRENHPSDGSFDSQGRAFAAEMLPAGIDFANVHFKLAPATKALANSVTARGQTIALPQGTFHRLYLLAAADGDQKGIFRAGDSSVELIIQDWTGYIGQWDTRLWKETVAPVRGRAAAGKVPAAVRMNSQAEYAGLVPGFVKPAPIAWFRNHRHASDGSNDPYVYSYLFAYEIDMPAGTKTLTLPDNLRIQILAMSVSKEASAVESVQPLNDALDRTHVADGFYGPGSGIAQN